ncbi:PTS lactose/cellobiose transporter subunit IIA [Vibrio lamellibrachiae]|uniref:PTS lactose/cellobiose transporter subunit IIA n=1 Tax=Vibrio lamellibrachiae TaxID=2910253 RepID=UPI003D0BE56D
MTTEEYEMIVMELITNAGQAKSEYMQAIRFAKIGDFDNAAQSLDEGRKFLNFAHEVQTKLIGLDQGEGKVKVTLVMVHAQDHLMNAVLMKELASEFVEIYKKLPSEK